MKRILYHMRFIPIGIPIWLLIMVVHGRNVVKIAGNPSIFYINDQP